MNKVNTINLSTDRLDLRIPTIEEQYRLWQILVDENVNKYYFPTPDRIFAKNNLSKESIEDLKMARKIFMIQLSDWERQKPFYEKKIESIRLQEDSQKFTWSIFLKDTNNVIGQITCQPKDNEPESVRDIGWFIDPRYQGNGYASEAASAVLEFMFNAIEITDINTSAAEINLASWRIMEKLGFEYVGTKKTTYFNDNSILDSKEYHCNKELFLNRNTNREESFDDVIIMKVGPHSGMSLQEIIDSKIDEEKSNGVHYWGYSGVFCKPVPTQKFCQESRKNNHQPKIILIETKSSYDSKIGFINEYSEDNITYKKFKAAVQLQGAEFSFVAKNIRKIKNFRLDDFVVVGGKNDGKLISEHLVFRVNKCFGKYNEKSNSKEIEVYVADLVEPYAIWLKDK